MIAQCKHFWDFFDYGKDISQCSQLLLVSGTHIILLFVLVALNFSTRGVVVGLRGWRVKFWIVWFSITVFVVCWSVFSLAHNIVHGGARKDDSVFDSFVNLERAFRIVTAFFSLRLQKVGSRFPNCLLRMAQIASCLYVLAFLLEMTSLVRQAVYGFQKDAKLIWDTLDWLQFVSSLTGIAMAVIIFTATADGRKRLIKAMSSSSLAAEDFSAIDTAKVPLLQDLIEETRELLASDSSVEDRAPAPRVSYDEANILSRILFKWINPLLKVGYARQLEFEDLPPLPNRIETERWAKRFSRILKEQRRASGRLASLFQVFHRCFGADYYWLGIGKLATDALGFAGPLLLKAIVKYVEEYQKSDDDNKPSTRNGVLLVVLLCLSSLAVAFIGTQYSFAIYHIQLRVRASLISAVFQRAMDLRIVDQKKTNVSTGEVTNLMSVDSQRLMDVASSFNELWSLPVQVGVTLYLLYKEVSFAFIAGVVIICAMIPLNMWIAKRISRVTSKLMDHKDTRVRLCHETMSGIRELKLLSLQGWLSEKVRTVRADEVRQLAARKYLDAWCVYFWAFMPTLVALATFGCLMIQPGATAPSASSVFTTIALLNMLIYPMNAFPWVVNGIMEAYVSLGRMQKFLLTPLARRQERTFDFDEDGNWNINTRSISELKSISEGLEPSTSETIVEFKSASFSWASPSHQPSATGSYSSFHLQDITLRLEKGQVIAVCGEVGSGKSMLINALLGELHLVQGNIFKSDGKVAYCGQRPWLQSGTLMSNITAFGNSLDDVESVLHACGLLEDVRQFPAGLETEIGERGVTLSGGQRQRVSLARAAFSKADLYLMDDPLSALDPRTAEHVLQNLIIDFVKSQLGAGCLFTTHAVHLLEKCDFVVVLKSGQIIESGRPTDLKLNKHSVFSSLVEKALKFDGQALIHTTRNSKFESKDAETATEMDNSDGKLFEKEQRMKGAVQVDVYKTYAQAVGWIVTIATLLSLVLMQLSANSFSYWLSYWTAHAEMPRERFWIISAGIAGSASVVTLLRSFLFAFGGLQAARYLHNTLFETVLKCPMIFFDKTPLGRLMNRFSADIFTIDDQLPFMLNILLAQTVGLLGTAIILIVSNAWSILVLVPVLGIYGLVQAYYRWSSRELRRLDSISRSPIFAHFSETLDGASVIRAFQAGQCFSRQNLHNLDINQRALLSGNAASQWLSLRLQMLGVLVVTFFASLAIIQCQFGATKSSQDGLVGLGLSYALSIVSSLNGLLSAFTETEKEMVSVERVKEYAELSPEENGAEVGLVGIPSSWPEEGLVQVKGLTVRYKSTDLPALDNISFEIMPGDKVGIIGRTGSGKSSLMMAFFRMVSFAGSIVIDGVDIRGIRLQLLRDRLSAIPQAPLLFSGSLRENLDPKGKYGDHELWHALERCHMKDSISQSAENKGLKAAIGHKGLSFSVGQRQLLCLARALLRKSKIVFIDEATANVDAHTDSLVQETLKENFSGCTMLMIAHRISSVFSFCNRVISLSDGKLTHDVGISEFNVEDLEASDPNLK